MKKVIITGGMGDLGMAIAKRFVEGGWDVFSLGREDLNLLDTEATHELFKTHSCDLLVCAAGSINDKPLVRMEEEAWDEVFLANYATARICAESALKGMEEAGGGHLIFIGSHAGEHPAIGQAAYATAKAALCGLMRSISENYGNQGIRSNVILPGFMETKMTAMVSEKQKIKVRSDHFLREFNTVEKTAEFIFHLEEMMEFTSGQIFQLDSR